MVSLESKFTYIERVQENPKLKAFNDFLNSVSVNAEVPIESSQADELFYGIIVSLQKNNREEFELLYNRKSKSKPNKESPSPFVNDDFLIFCLVIGVMKYQLDRSWLKKIVGIRNQSPTTLTLANILNENLYSKDNLPEIIVAFSQLHALSNLTNDLLNTAFTSINSNTKLFENKSDFQILCALKSYETCIILKEAPKGSEVELLKAFKSRFVKRMKIVSWILQTSFLIVLLYGLLKLPTYSPKIVEMIGTYGYAFTILGALGITLFSNQFSYIKNKSQELTMTLFGYPKELMKG